MIWHYIGDTLIEILKESRGPVLGYKVHGKLTEADIGTLGEQIEATIAANRHPIGILADLSSMDGATWDARWAEMRFLQKHSDHIARIAIICHDEHQELSEMVLIAASFMQAETVYCQPHQIHHAWHWLRQDPNAPSGPLRTLYPGKGLFQNYTPEYIGL